MHLDNLAILVRDVPNVWDAFDMHHGSAQLLPNGAGHDQHSDGEDEPEQAQRPWTKLTRPSVTPLLGKQAHRIAHAMKADIIRRIKEECETLSQAHHIKGNGLAYIMAPL